MLILERKLEQTIVIQVGDREIVIKVTDFPRSGRVKLGIAAPEDVIVMRGELQS